MIYNADNIFAKIIAGEIPCTKVYEDEFVLAIHNIHPQRKIHVLILAKVPFADIRTFAADADQASIIGFMRAIPLVTEALGITQDGYRLITNTSGYGQQEIPHLHFHLLSGELVGPLVTEVL
jgi:diadenosine tetraphosphate (Ap4A) HIT family hydrolase